MESRVDGRALEMKEAIRKVFGEQLKNALAEKDNTAKLIASYKLQLENYQNQTRDIEAAIEEQRKKLPDFLANGEDLGKISKKVSELKGKFAEVNEWIEALERDVLPPEVTRITQIQATIQDIFHLSIVQFREQYQADLNKKAKDFLETDILAWRKTYLDLMDELKTKNTSPHLRKIHIKNRTIRDHTDRW